ncbi:MAG: hypothetical protein ACE14P_01850 [Methanotrichaceae archaeon]
MALLRRARFCSWKIGTRTACPVLVDNLPSDKLDRIWSEISRINFAAHKDAYREAHKGDKSDENQKIIRHEQVPKRRNSNIKKSAITILCISF